jgi:hypothetical protein
MVTTLPTQWEDVHLRIGIEPENAINAHVQVRVELETDAKLQEWGVDTVLIGSYRRKTAIYPCKDVDVFVKLPKAPADATPEEVFTEVQRVLVARFKGRAAEQRRSMKISGFADGLTVDAVPAVPDGSRWKIPQTDVKPVGEHWVKDRWETTDPERLTTFTEDAQAASPTISGKPSYVRTVRLIKQLRDIHVGQDEKPGGLYFELLTHWAFRQGVTADSYAELLVPVLDSISQSLGSGIAVTEPAMERPYAPAPDAAKMAQAALAFGRLAAEARIAPTLDECAAAAVWRQMLGRNEKVGWCFPLPLGCTDSGTRIAALPNKDRGSDADRGFA